MNLDELKAESHKIKNDLEGILGTFRVSESEVYFVHRGDIAFIKQLINDTDAHYTEEVSKVNTDMIAPADMKPYRFSDKDKKIIDRIVEHAKQYRESGIVKYRIQDCYMTSQEVKEAIKIYLDSKFLNRSDFRFLGSTFSYLDKYNLSAKQIIIIEKIFDKVDERTEREGAGIIYFDLTGDPEINDMGNRLINCALGRGRNPDAVCGGDVIEAKDKYFCKGEAGLDELRERLRIEMKGKGRTDRRIFSQYEPVIKLLERYMAAINPDSYFIDGLKCAIPKDIV